MYVAQNMHVLNTKDFTRDVLMRDVKDQTNVCAIYVMIDTFMYAKNVTLFYVKSVRPTRYPNRCYWISSVIFVVVKNQKDIKKFTNNTLYKILI